MTPAEALAVMALFERADDHESLFWRIDMESAGEPSAKLFAQCSDFFHYATADLEEIGAADIPVLAACLTDLRETGEPYYLAELFAARKRKMRPLAGSYQEMNPATRALFDACSTAEERAEVSQRDAAFWRSVAAGSIRRARQP